MKQVSKMAEDMNQQTWLVNRETKNTNATDYY